MGAPNHCRDAELLLEAPKSPNNVTSTFFNTVNLPSKELRFDDRDAKRRPWGLVFCPGRHLTSLRPCLRAVIAYRYCTIKSHNGQSRCRQYKFQKSLQYEFVTSHWHLLRLHSFLHPCIHDASGQRGAAEQIAADRLLVFQRKNTDRQGRPQQVRGPTQDLGARPLWINGVVTSSCSVNRATTFLVKMFSKITI